MAGWCETFFTSGFEVDSFLSFGLAASLILSKFYSPIFKLSLTSFTAEKVNFKMTAMQCNLYSHRSR